MPPKKKGHSKSNRPDENNRDLVYKEDGSEYAKVMSLLGDRKIMLIKPDRTEIMGVIPGRHKRRCRFNINDVALIGFRDFQENKVDVLYKYTDKEVKKLVQYGEIPEWYTKNSVDITAGRIDDPDDDIGFDFVTADEEIDIDDI